MFVLVESITVDATDANELPPAAARNWYWAAVEVNMAVFDREFIEELDARQESYAERSREITLEEVRDWSILRRLRNNLLALASPLL